jgi:WD40 repeat protein
VANGNKKPVVTYSSGSSNWEPVAWNPNGKWIACGGADNTIVILDSASGKAVTTLPGHTESIFSLAWNSDGTRLASTSHDGTVRTWDLSTGKGLPLLTINASGSGITSAEWSPTGGKLATSSGFTNLGGTDDYNVRIWDAETGKLLATLEGHNKPVMRAKWSPDGTRLASAGLDNVIRIWSVG